MTDKAQTFSAFAHAFTDCLLLFSRRLRNSAPNVVRSLVGGSPESDTVLRDFVRKQTSRFVEEIFQGRLQLDPSAATKPLSEVITKLDEVDKGLANSAAPRSLVTHRFLMRPDLSKTAWECVSDGYIRLLQTPPPSIEVQHFTYLKYLQLSTAGALFEDSVKRLIRQTYNVVIGALSQDLDSPPENRTDHVRAGSILKALLDVWGKDELEDSESSAVCLRFCFVVRSSSQPRSASSCIYGRKVATGCVLWTFPNVNVPGTPSRTTRKRLLAPGSQRHRLLLHKRSLGLVRWVQRHGRTVVPSAFPRLRSIHQEDHPRCTGRPDKQPEASAFATRTIRFVCAGSLSVTAL
jgi:hypothetical protein